MWDFIEKRCKYICIKVMYQLFCIFDDLYHVCNSTFQPMINYFYHREPEKEIEEPQYYRIIDLLENDEKVYDTNEERTITNDVQTLYPASIHNFSDEDTLVYKHELYEPNMLIDSIWLGKFQYKSDTYYHCFTMWNNKNRNFDSVERYIIHGIKVSQVEFLFVEYNHPKMHHSIELKVPKTFLICENEIFSVGFVFYLLQKQDTTFVFDLDYRIDILDGAITKVELTSSDYLRLQENAYQILHLEN